MNLFGLRISVSRNRNSKIKNQISEQRNFDPAAWLRGDEHRPARVHLSNAYEQVVWVYRAINALAEQVANIPFLFSRGDCGRENLITSGPLIDFYNRPHPRLNRFQYWELRVLWLLLRGECYRLPVFRDTAGHQTLSSGAAICEVPHLSDLRHANGKCDPGPRSAGTHRHLDRIIFLDPDHIQPVIENNSLIGYRYKAPANLSELEPQVFLPEEIWFERLPNPFDPWHGLAPLHVAESPAKSDFIASAFMRGVLENNAENGLIVRTEQDLSDEQREQIRASLRARKHSAGTADQSILLWGTTEIVHPKLSSADLQFLDNRKFSRTEICAAFGVPEEIVTATDYNKYDVMQGARQNFIENRVAPLCARLEAEESATTIQAITAGSSIQNQNSKIENLIVPPRPSDGRGIKGEGLRSIENQNSKIQNSVIGWFDLDSLPIMQKARRDRLAAAKTGFDMGIPFNELNRAFDLGFPSLPWGNTGYLSTTIQPIASLLPEAPPARSQAEPATPKAHISAAFPDDLSRVLSTVPKPKDLSLPALLEKALAALTESTAGVSPIQNQNSKLENPHDLPSYPTISHEN